MKTMTIIYLHHQSIQCKKKRLTKESFFIHSSLSLLFQRGKTKKVWAACVEKDAFLSGLTNQYKKNSFTNTLDENDDASLSPPLSLIEQILNINIENDESNLITW